MDTIKLTVYLPPQVHAALKRMAQDDGRSLTKQVEELLRAHAEARGILRRTRKKVLTEPAA